MTPANGTSLEEAAVVVLPAWLEDQPRRLLRAVATGVSVFAADACGLDGISGARTVSAGDVQALRKAVAQVMNGRQGCDPNRNPIYADPMTPS